MSHGSTRARYDAATDDVDEPLRSIAVREPQPDRFGPVLRSLLRPFLASWPILIVGVIVAPAIALAMQSRAPITYTAEALVAPNRTRTDVQFVPQIKTVDDNSATTATAGLSAERRQALVDLMKSSNIELQVINDLKGKLPDEQLQRGVLVQQISGGMRPRSEILSIQAFAASPADALTIVNAWAKNYVQEINRLYAPASSDGSMLALRDQAQKNLDAAQAALNDSIATSQLETLDQQIQDKQALVTLLQSPYQAPATNGTNGTNGTNDQRQQGNPNGSTQSGISNDYRLADRRSLDDLAQTLRRVDATRQTVRTLLTHAQAGTSGGSSDAAALALIKTQLVAISDSLPSQLQLQLPTGSTGSSAQDLESLAASLDAAHDQLGAQFDTARQAYEQKNAQAIADLEQQLQDLRAQREGANAERTRLSAARDLASDTYTALAKKVEEQRVANSTSGHEVELASEASFAAPLPRQSNTALIIAAMIGLAVAGALALVRWFAFGAGAAYSAIPGWTPRTARSERTPST